MLIYIAGPYSAETEEERLANTIAAIDAGIKVFQKGHIPFIPHLSHWVDKRAKETGINLTWEDYMKWDEEILKRCDALLFLKPSRGANIELENAKKMGKIIYHSIDEIHDANKPMTVRDWVEQKRKSPIFKG